MDSNSVSIRDEHSQTIPPLLPSTESQDHSQTPNNNYSGLFSPQPINSGMISNELQIPSSVQGKHHQQLPPVRININNNNNKFATTPKITREGSQSQQIPTPSATTANNVSSSSSPSTKFKIQQKAAQAQEKVAPYIQFITQTAFRILSTSRTLRRLSPVWSLMGSCILGYLFPLFYPSTTVILTIVGILFFLVGLSVPLKEWTSTLVPMNKTSQVIFVFVAQFLVAPAITMAMLFFITWFSSGTAGTLARSFAVGVAACLPPSPSMAATLTNVAGGSDGLAFLISTLVNTVGLVLVPFLAQLTVAAAGSEETQLPGKHLGVSLREATQLISYLVLTTLIPLGFGCAVQTALLYSGRSININNNNISSSSAANSDPSSSAVGDVDTSMVIMIPNSPKLIHSSENNTTSTNATLSSHQQQAQSTTSALSLFESCCPPAIDNNNNSSSSSKRKDHFGGVSYQYDDGVTNSSDDQPVEFCGGRIIFSRMKIRKIIGSVSFVLRYCCFILMFQQSQHEDSSENNNNNNHHSASFVDALADPKSLLSWGQLLKTFLFAILAAAVNGLLVFFTIPSFTSLHSITGNENNNNNNNKLPLSNSSTGSSTSGIHPHTPNNNNSFVALTPLAAQQILIEERIALMFAAMQKADLLIAPIFSQLFVSRIHGRVVVLMCHAFIFCFANTLFLALMAIGPLQEWKRRQLCRPGASFLPSKFSRIPAHHHALAPTTANSVGPSSNRSSNTLFGNNTASSNNHPSNADRVTSSFHNHSNSHHHHHSSNLELDNLEKSSNAAGTNISNNNASSSSSVINIINNSTLSGVNTSSSAPSSSSSPSVAIIGSATAEIAVTTTKNLNNLVKSVAAGIARATTSGKSEHSKA